MHENVQTVRRIYAEQVAHPEAVRELYDPDYETDLTDAGPDVGVVVGFDAAEEALRPYWEIFEDFRYEIEEVIHADERASDHRRPRRRADEGERFRGLESFLPRLELPRGAEPSKRPGG